MHTSEFVLPYDKWLEFVEKSASISVASEAPSASDGKPASVRAAAIEGKLLATVSVLYGGFPTSYADTWSMTPRSQWEGATTPVFRDEVALADGSRQRGDFQGCLVTYHGKEYVFASRIKVGVAPPSARSIITLEMAQDYYGREEVPFVKSQWELRRWEFAHGHPVGIVTEDNEEMGVLYFRHKGSIQRLMIRDPSAIRSAAAIEAAPCTKEQQLLLF